MRFLALFLVLNCALTARADVIATYRILDKDKIAARSPDTRVLATNGAKLQETWSGVIGESGVTYNKTWQLSQNDLNRVVTLDAALKIYKTEPMIPVLPPGFAFPEIRVSKIGREKMLGFETNHFTVDLTFELEAPARGKTLARQEIWVLPVTQLPGLPTTTRNFGVVPREKISGDTQFWDEIQSGIWVKKVIFEPILSGETNFKPLFNEELSSLTICTFSPALLEIPGDCREVPGAEFERLRAQNKREIEARQNQTGPVVIAPRATN